MSTAPAPYRTGNIVAALAAVGACDIAFGLTLQLMPLLMEREGWPAWAIGLNVAMGPIGILMAGPFLPKFLGRVGTRRAAFALIAILMPLTRARTRADLLAACEGEGVPAGPINDLADVFADPQVIARGLRIDAGGVPGVRTPIVFSDATLSLDRPSPVLGPRVSAG